MHCRIDIMPISSIKINNWDLFWLCSTKEMISSTDRTMKRLECFVPWTDSNGLGTSCLETLKAVKSWKEYNYLYCQLFYIGRWFLSSTRSYYTICMVSIIYSKGILSILPNFINVWPRFINSQDDKLGLEYYGYELYGMKINALWNKRAKGNFAGYWWNWFFSLCSLWFHYWSVFNLILAS